MDNKLIKYLNALQIGIDNFQTVLDAKKYLLSKDVKYLSNNRKDVAALFYQVLCSFQRILGDDAIEEYGEQIIYFFKHISLLNPVPDVKNEDSNMMIIWFLHELYQKAREGKATSIGDELKVYIELLMTSLNDIRFILRIEENGKRAFPLNLLISKAISDNSFMSMSSITPYHIKVFQLAVELFDERDDKQVVEKLKKDCNLGFLDFMDGSHIIIDTKDFLNYQKNGVMIFYSCNKNSVLIRHEKKTYFNSHGKYPSIQIMDEKNCRKEIIGHYVIIENIKTNELIDYSQIMEKDALNILKLIYEQGYYNIFHQKALYLCDGVVRPINPYAMNDMFIVKGYIDKNGRFYSKDRFQDVIRKYRMMKIGGSAIDAVTFGLCQYLLEKDNIGVDKLGINENVGGDWLQSRVVKNWVLSSNNCREALEVALKKYCKDLGYCNSNIDKYDIQTQDILPYSCGFGWMYELLGLPQNEYSIFMAVVDLNEDNDLCLRINNFKTMASRKFSGIQSIVPEELGVYCSLTDDEKEEYLEIGREHYLIFDSEKNKWIGEKDDEEVYRYLSQVEVLLNRNSLSYELKDMININHINDIKEYMLLHAEALMAVGDDHPLFADFDSMMLYRLMHTMIWNRIKKETWESFYNIIHGHQKLSFSDIREDVVFRRQEQNILYVPKDNSGVDGTLCKAYYKYMAEKMSRDRKNPFSPKITLKNGRYFVNGNEIKKIVFLFDNTCSGTATCNTLAFYLDKEMAVAGDWEETRKEKFRNTQQKYQVKDKVVSVHDIIETNAITEIHVHSYYGTDEGIIRIKALLQECGYNGTRVDYGYKIERYFKQIERDAEKIWKINQEEDYCLFIREFNQPKKNVFPGAMLNDAKKAICIFVKKPE